MSALLEARGLRVTFGGVHAIDDIDLEVPAGGFVGLIGPNGAGKTTFIDAVTGYVPVSAGEVRFGGVDLTRSKPHQRADLGLARTFQSLELFEDLSVRDNLLIAAQPARWYTVLNDLIGRSKPTAEMRRPVDWALGLLDLEDVADSLPTDLSHGRRKLVAVARSLAAEPRLVMLDEPAAGLDTSESTELGHRLRSVLDHDVSVFLIDHDMGLVLAVCDYIYVLDFGRIIAAGTPDEIRSDPAVIAAYLGEREPGAPTAPGASGVGRSVVSP